MRSASWVALLAEYEQFLRRHRGFAESTISSYLDYLRRFCRAVARAGIVRWDDLPPATVYAHLRRQSARLGIECLRKSQTAYRGFFRYLRATGRSSRELDAFLVPHRVFGQARVPRTLTIEEVARLFATVRGDGPGERRDRAILLFLVVYGLRLGELARLRLEDLQWRAQRVVLRRRKNGRDLVLPLLPAVARVLADYLEHVRPRPVGHREVFLSATGNPYSRGSALGAFVRDRVRQARLDVPPHALRHSLASRLLNRNCPPELVQQILGHSRFDSTRIYAKVDLAHLREVADLAEVLP